MDLHKPRMDGYSGSDSILAEEDVVGPWDPKQEHSWMNIGHEAGQNVPWEVMVQNSGKPFSHPHAPRDLAARAVMLAWCCVCWWALILPPHSSDALWKRSEEAARREAMVRDQEPSGRPHRRDAVQPRVRGPHDRLLGARALARKAEESQRLAHRRGQAAASQPASAAASQPPTAAEAAAEGRTAEAAAETAKAAEAFAATASTVCARQRPSCWGRQGADWADQSTREH
jgi:hypothetical protein